MKIWTCGSSPRSGSRNAWTRIKNVNGESVWVIFGFLSARNKWFPVAIGDHGRNLVISLWAGNKATINIVGAWRLTLARPKKFRLQNHTGKSPDCLDFSDQDGIGHIDYLSKGQTFDVEYYSSLLVQMKDILKEKGRGMITKFVLFLHDNTPNHRSLATQKKVVY